MSFHQWSGAALLLLSSMAASAGTVTINLYAGNPKNDAANKVVGTVTIATGPPTSSIAFNITKSGYCLTGYHIYVGSQPPNTSAPGQYPYKKTLPCVTSHTVTPAINIPVGYYVAVHGEVNYGCEASPLPSSPVTMCSTGFKTDNAYIDKLVLNPPLPGTAQYEAWCAARGIFLPSGNIFLCATPYTAAVYSSLVTPPGGWGALLNVVNPNWKAISYLLSKIDTPGYMVPGNYSTCDIQNAIWALEGFSIAPTSCTQNYDSVKTAALVAEAIANAPVLGCVPGKKAAVVLIPKQGNDIFQPVLYGATCKCKDDTIWAIPGLLNTPAYSFVGFKTGWGGYFLMP